MTSSPSDVRLQASANNDAFQLRSSPAHIIQIPWLSHLIISFTMTARIQTKLFHTLLQSSNKRQTMIKAHRNTTRRMCGHVSFGGATMTNIAWWWWGFNVSSKQRKFIHNTTPSTFSYSCLPSSCIMVNRTRMYLRRPVSGLRNACSSSFAEMQFL